MDVRVLTLLRKANISFDTLKNILDLLGYKGVDLSLNKVLPNYINDIVLKMCSDDGDLSGLIETIINKERDCQVKVNSQLKILGWVDVDGINRSRKRNEQDENNNNEKKELKELYNGEVLKYDVGKSNFWLQEVFILDPFNRIVSLQMGDFLELRKKILFSILIGMNGVGKSSLLSELVDFFLDLHLCCKGAVNKLSRHNGMLKGVRYHIDGKDCFVVRMDKNYLVKIDGYFCPLKNLRLPSLVACHFGAFEKFHNQTLNGAVKTKYDVPYYKYVGAHINGNMISSSSIIFRLLFVLNKNWDNRQLKNICSILDLINYDHIISLQYSMSAKKDDIVRNIIAKHIVNDREYNNLDEQNKKNKVNQLFEFYKSKKSEENTNHLYTINFDASHLSLSHSDELQCIYKLKQCDLVNSVKVLFYKNKQCISSDEMSSGEFSMLSTILSISVSVSKAHSLVLIDEPEISLHPNWQMSFIEMLDKALENQVCQLLIATHSHMIVSDLPMNRSNIVLMEKNEKGCISSELINSSTYGWSSEEVLLKVFKTATDRNRYFGERIAQLLEAMMDNSISQSEVVSELSKLEEISRHLNDIDPMKSILNLIIDKYYNL